MTTPQDIIVEARSWVGTKFSHQGRVKGEFVDCAGLIIGVARSLQLAEYDEIPYGVLPLPSVMEKILDQYLVRVRMAGEQPGDVFWMKDIDAGGKPRHVGILTDAGTIIHADSKFGACVEHQFDPRYRRAVVRWYRFKGVV